MYLTVIGLVIIEIFTRLRLRRIELQIELLAAERASRKGGE